MPKSRTDWYKGAVGKKGDHILAGNYTVLVYCNESWRRNQRRDVASSVLDQIALFCFFSVIYVFVAETYVQAGRHIYLPLKKAVVRRPFLSVSLCLNFLLLLVYMTTDLGDTRASYRYGSNRCRLSLL